jgi:DNA-binding TFAR19-related protein (PDSD5 family)
MSTDEIHARTSQPQQEAGLLGGDSQANEVAQRREAEETRRDILATLLEPAARERCKCIWVLSSETI